MTTNFIIYIDNTKVNVYEIDSIQSILTRYIYLTSLVKSNNTKFEIPTIPSFLRLISLTSQESINDVSSLEISGKYIVEDVRDIILDTFIENLTENIPKIILLYPLLTAHDVYLIWLIENHDMDLSKINFIKKYKDEGYKSYLSGRSFSNPEITFSEMKKYSELCINISKKIKRDISKEDIIYAELYKVTPFQKGSQIKSLVINDKSKIIDLNPENIFTLEDVQEDTHLFLPNLDSLYDIFNAVVVSKYIPFVILSSSLDDIGHNNELFKVYQNIIPPDDWLDIDTVTPNQRSIYFWISNIEPFDGMKFDDYAEVDWSENNVITVRTNIEKGLGVKFILQKLFESLRGRIEYQEAKVVQGDVRGKFTFVTPNFIFNRAVFLDLICIDPIFSYFLSINEQSKSSLEKKRLSFYYNPDHNNFATNNNIQSLKILTLTLSASLIEDLDETTVITVRISHAKNMNQVNTFIKVFIRLFTIYMKKQPSIIKLYESLYAPSKELFKKYEPKKDIEEEENKKSGQRLLNLEKMRPEYFKKGYWGVCHPRKRQPYLITSKDEMENIRKKMKKAEPTAKYPNLKDILPEDGFLNWPTGSKDWYACYPREDIDKDKSFVWPGLIKNTKGGPIEEFPCCYVSNQSTKKGKTVKTKKEIIINYDKEVNIYKVIGVPLAPNKMSPVDRYTLLPYYLQIIALSAGYEVEAAPGIKNLEYLPILAYGVAVGPDSFVHCLARAYNDNYKKLDTQGRQQLVTDTLNYLSTVDDDYLTVARQEMYDYTYDEIRLSLRTSSEKNNVYIDPDIYINIFAKHYACDILIFKVDEENPNGEVVIPRASIAYLAYKIDPNPEKDVAIILKYRKRPGIYQCELLCKVVNNEIKYSFEHDDLFVKRAFEIFTSTNAVYITNPDGHNGSIRYEPSFIR